MVKVSKDVEEFYAEEESSHNNVEWVNIPQISIKKGQFATQEETVGGSMVVRPIALYTKFMRAGGKGDNYAPVAETVMVRNGDSSPYYDTLGTEMLGRTPGAKTDAEKAKNKELGTFYAVLFMIHNNTLYRFQCPNAKAMEVVNFYRKLESKYPFSNEVEIKITKEDRLALATSRIDLPADEIILASVGKVKEHVDQQNMKVMAKYNRHSGKSRVNSTELDDQIPF